MVAYDLERLFQTAYTVRQFGVLSWSVCCLGVSRRALPMTTSVGLSIARHASLRRYAESVDTIGVRLIACSRPRIAVMALRRTNIAQRGI